jgi:hypothetical protein
MTTVRLREINTYINTISKNSEKLTWVLIVIDFCRFFDNFKEQLAMKSRIHWFYCYYYHSKSHYLHFSHLTRLNARVVPRLTRWV